MSTVLILGAASDMAIAIAKEFGSHGYNLQLAARNLSQLDLIKKDLSVRYNIQCTTHLFDALQYNSHDLFFNSLHEKPDITVCVFGVMYDEDASWDKWDLTQKMIDTNYTGAVSILNIAAKYYVSKGAGTIVGISSVAGERGRQSKLIYGSTKAAFTAYLSGLRNKLFKNGVHVVTVKPGFVYTKLTEELSLPPLLTAQPALIGEAVYSAVSKKKNTVYVKWMWRYIMLIIKNIPEFIFKKLNL